MNIVEKNNDKINALCKKHKEDSLFVFGSVLTDKFKNSSDIDLLIKFTDVHLYEYADNYFDFKAALEKFFKRPVDLLENQAIRNPYLRKSIDSSKKKSSMHNDIKTWQFDVLESINEIDSHYENKSKVYADYVLGIKMKSSRAKSRNYG